MGTRGSRRVRITALLLGIGLAATACASSGSGKKPAKNLGEDGGRAIGSVGGPGSRGGTTTYGSNVGTGLAGVGTLPTPASAWPAASYDARHSSGTKAVGPQSAKVRWKHQLGGNATPGPANRSGVMTAARPMARRICRPVRPS